MMKRALLLAALAALLAPAAARAYERPPLLSQVASKFAMREAVVNCPTRTEWNTDIEAQGTWGYTYLVTNELTIGPLVCAGALHAADPKWPAWQRALGALVLTHESYHVRLWTWRADEARVECQAIRHFKYAVQFLGGTRADADFLLPYALAIHWRLAARIPEYNRRDCKVPNFWHTI